MRTLRQLLKATPPNTKRLATVVKITATKARKSRVGNPTMLAKTRSTQDAKGKPIRPAAASVYVSSVEMLDAKGNVRVSCGCADFMYRLEYKLNKVGAADIEYSNGEPPTVRAAEAGPWLCKHLTALANHMIKEGLA